MAPIYLCIDLKSFYASVECVERGLDPMTTNLVVADPERSKGTLCLAVSPSMKKLGVKNRCRVYEIPPGIDYIMAPPRMQLYIDYAAKIYELYLEYISQDDIHVYSVDESFIDITRYLTLYHKTAREMAVFLMNQISERLGIRSTCGIGTNLYLTKVALDIVAKHSPDFIGYLDESLYRELLWDHQPITDFWMIAGGKSAHLAKLGIMTQRGIATADPDVLYKEFGIDAELMIDHAWGRESTTMEDIKRYKPKSHCLSSFQILLKDYDYEGGELILKEMTDLMCLDMVHKHVVTDTFGMYVGYSHTILFPSVHATVRLPRRTNADMLVIPAVVERYHQLVTPGLSIRHIGISAGSLSEDDGTYQMDLFSAGLTEQLESNRKIQEAVLEIKKKYGRDTILKVMNYQEDGMTIKRNHQIGGHKSGD